MRIIVDAHTWVEFFIGSERGNKATKCARKEVGSGLNDRRRKLLKMLRCVIDGRADVVLVEYKDRLTRLGFNYLNMLCRSHGARIESVHDNIKKDATQELVEDMISIVQSFSARLYGRRSHKYKRVVGGLKSAVHDTC